jgi:hypothetical protein
MLPRFRVANVRSLRDEQELSFVALAELDAERIAARETERLRQVQRHRCPAEHAP